MDPPAPAVGNAGEFLDVDVDQLTRTVTLIADHRRLGGSVPSVESAKTFGGEDLLHRRTGPADLKADVCSAPTTLLAKLDDPAATLLRRGLG